MRASTPTSGPCTISDMLPEASRLAREWAPHFCAPSYVRHEGCADYHAGWSTLRLIGAITGARTDKDFFYKQFLISAQENPNARVLIAGTADHALLHMLLEAFGALGAQPDITVVDACATTLKLNQWYAEQFGARVSCIQADLRQIDLPARFDLITTHSVLSFMQLADVSSTLSNWNKHLADAGKLVMVQGIRPALHGSSYLVFSDAEEANFIARAQKCWEISGPFPGLDLPTVRALAQKFAHHKKNIAITSSRLLLDAISTAGLTPMEHEEINRHGLNYRSSAPDENEQAFSIRVVAMRTGMPTELSDGRAV